MATPSSDQPALRPARPRRARPTTAASGSAGAEVSDHVGELRELLEATIDHLVSLEEKVDRLSADIASLKASLEAPADAPAAPSARPRRRRTTPPASDG